MRQASSLFLFQKFAQSGSKCGANSEILALNLLGSTGASDNTLFNHLNPLLNGFSYPKGFMVTKACFALLSLERILLNFKIGMLSATVANAFLTPTPDLYASYPDLTPFAAPKIGVASKISPTRDFVPSQYSPFLKCFIVF